MRVSFSPLCSVLELCTLRSKLCWSVKGAAGYDGVIHNFNEELETSIAGPVQFCPPNEVKLPMPCGLALRCSCNSLYLLIQFTFQKKKRRGPQLCGRECRYFFLKEGEGTREKGG